MVGDGCLCVTISWVLQFSERKLWSALGWSGESSTVYKENGITIKFSDLFIMFICTLRVLMNLLQQY